MRAGGLSPEEIYETARMFAQQHLDVRAVTLGISLLGYSQRSGVRFAETVGRLVKKAGKEFVAAVDEVAATLGIPIVNRRIAVTPIAVAFGRGSASAYLAIAEALDGAAREAGVDFVGGFSALVHKGIERGDAALVELIPEALARTERVCSSVNVASTKSGINMDAVAWMGRIVKETARRTARRRGIGATKLCVFANIPEDNPFMAGAVHGFGGPERVINVAVSGPGVVREVVRSLKGADLSEVAEQIKKTAFKISRVGELVGREVSERLGVEFGIVDLSLAPSPVVGDSVAQVLEEIGVASAGAPGSTAALFLLTEAVKRGGSFAVARVGGLSGAFIPVMEDSGMAQAVGRGSLSLEKLEAMTAVCSVGLDMVPVPGDTPAETIAALIADEMAIGVANDKTTGARIVPVPGKKAGQQVNFGGLFGSAPVMRVSKWSSGRLIKRGGRIPPAARVLRN